MMKAKSTDKRSDILKATIKLIAKNGFHGTPTSMIAKKAGVGIGSIYRYFKNKDELIHELHRYLKEKLSEVILKDYNDQAPITARFIYLHTNIFRYLKENHDEYKFLEQYYYSPFGITMRKEKLLCKKPAESLETQCRNLFEVAKSRQIIKDFPMNVIEAITLSPIMSLLRDYEAGLVELNDEIINDVIEACWDSIKR